MKVVFYASDKPREIMLAKALEQGVVSAGDTFELRRTADYGEDELGNDMKWPGPSPDTDVACVFGVKGKSRDILKDHRAMNIATLHLDKGYTRSKGEGGHTEYSRISVNAADPLAYMLDKRFNAGDRLKKLGLKLEPYKKKADKGGHILYCGSSQKYHEFHGLPDATSYAQRVIRDIAKVSKRHIIYRPKPSWKNAEHIKGASFSSGTNSLEDALRGCACLVTHGSSAALEAAVAGVPTVTLGMSIARPVSGVSVAEIENFTPQPDDFRQRWLRAVAYCQWTTEELRTGEAWASLKFEIMDQAK